MTTRPMIQILWLRTIRQKAAIRAGETRRTANLGPEVMILMILLYKACCADQKAVANTLDERP